VDGSGAVPLLPEITDETDSYTFVHPEGLLYATQFTQPALVLVEKAAFDDMQKHGVRSINTGPLPGY
jgi:fatty acid synthase subunit beta